MGIKAKIIKDDKSQFYDTLQNLVSNMGTDKDKNLFSNIVDNPELSGQGSRVALSALYRNDWVSGKVVDIIPDDMTREWRTFNGDITPEQVQQLEDEEKRIRLQPKLNLAHKWGRLYGTGLLVISVNDGKKPEEPLDIESLKPGSLRHIQPIDRFRLNHAEVQPEIDPLEANYGMPKYYRFNETSVRIHHSRVIRFDSVMLPYDDFRENNYFSDSILKRLHDAIIDFKTSTSASSSLIHEANVSVIKIKGLMTRLATKAGENILLKRFGLANLMKSINNMLLLDADEDYANHSQTFAGLPDLIDRFSKILASASDIPATRLLGDSPSGLNATGEGDMRNYHDKVRSLQIIDYSPKLEYLDKIIAKSLGFKDDADLSFEFNPLFQLNDKEQAELENSRADRDKKYLDMGVVNEVIIAEDLQQQGTYTNLYKEYIEELKEIDEELNNGSETDTTEGENLTEPNSEGESEEEGRSSKSE